MRIKPLLESADSGIKRLALLVQAAFIEDLDWNLELDHKDGFIVGELKMSTGQVHGEEFIFIDKDTVLVVEPDMLKNNTVSSVVRSGNGTMYVHVTPTREAASRFVKDYYT